MPRRVVINGMRLVSPAGCSVEHAWRRLLDGHSAVRRIRRFDASHFPSQIAAEIDDESLATLPDDSAVDGVAADGDRIARYAAAATAVAVDDPHLLDAHVNRQRVGVAMAAGMGRYDHHEVFTSCARAAAGCPVRPRACG